jgi:hypothetical protein
MVKEKRYEEYAYVLDFMPKARSKIVKNREGTIVQAVGEEYFTLLELLVFDDASFKIGERIYVGEEKRDKILSVLGKLSADDLTERAKESLRNKNIPAQIINKRIKHFQNLINEQLFPWHKLGSKPAPIFPFDKLCERLGKELSREIPENEWILCGRGGWRGIRRVVGRRAKYWVVRGGTIVGNSRHLGSRS